MEKNNTELILIICGIIMIFISSVISLMLGGSSTPYVPSIQGLVILIGVIIFYFGLKKSSLDIRKNILIILILLVSALISSMLFANINGSLTIYNYIMLILMLISCVISFVYIISQNVDNISLKNKLSFIGDKSKFFCLGIILIFSVCVFLGNTGVAGEHGHFILEHGEFNVIDSSKIVETGYWVYSDTGKPTGEKEYTHYGPTFKFDFKFSLDNITWDGKGLDINEIKNQINNGLLATIYLYDENGNYINKFDTNMKLDGNNVIINNSTNILNSDFNLNEDNVKYVEVHLIEDRKSFDISSNRCSV